MGRIPNLKERCRRLKDNAIRKMKWYGLH